jgi:integrative and conjugative element protein (TIGR02256 family)
MILRSGLRLVEVADEVVGTIEGYSRAEEAKREAGGILIGAYRGPHVEIVACTTPMPKDRRLWNLFDRNDPGHRAQAMRHWRESGRTLTFVGEWHTHPEQVPTPSFIDRITWKRAGRRHNAGPLVFMIRGLSGWWWGLAQEKTLNVLAPLEPRPYTPAVRMAAIDHAHAAID